MLLQEQRLWRYFRNRPANTSMINVGIGSSCPEKWRANHGSVFAEGVIVGADTELTQLPRYH